MKTDHPQSVDNGPSASLNSAEGAGEAKEKTRVAADANGARYEIPDEALAAGAVKERRERALDSRAMRAAPAWCAFAARHLNRVAAKVKRDLHGARYDIHFAYNRAFGLGQARAEQQPEEIHRRFIANNNLHGTETSNGSPVAAS